MMCGGLGWNQVVMTLVFDVTVWVLGFVNVHDSELLHEEYSLTAICSFCYVNHLLG
jgi:hypothetical protein